MSGTKESEQVVERFVSESLQSLGRSFERVTEATYAAAADAGGFIDGTDLAQAYIEKEIIRPTVEAAFDAFRDAFKHYESK